QPSCGGLRGRDESWGSRVERPRRDGARVRARRAARAGPSEDGVELDLKTGPGGESTRHEAPAAPQGATGAGPEVGRLAPGGGGQKRSARIPRPPATGPSARQVNPLTVLLTNRTLPSAFRALTPPG